MKKTAKNSGMTLLRAMEKIVEVARGSQLKQTALRKAKAEIKYLAERYGITEQQAVIFCICLEKGARRVDYNDLSNYLDINRIRIYGYTADIDALVRRRLLKYRDIKDEEDFDVPTVVLRMLRHNEVYQLPNRKGIGCAELFQLLQNWFEDLSDDAMTAREMREEVEQLMEDNPQINFVRQVKQLDLRDDDLLLLVYFCHLLVNEDDNDIRFGQIDTIYDSPSDYNRAKSELRAGTHSLMEMKLIEHLCEDGIVNTQRFRLTDYAQRSLLEEMNITPVEEGIVGVLKAEDLSPKKMFYPKDVEKQVKDLTALFHPDEFSRIQERMQERGFRNGFACLFYGSPGTGKTETVYQLAVQTGRAIMVVDVPQIKSKWVGDSEKNIKALFDRYREAVKRSKLAPILLFNEADAIIGKRRENAERAVDKMENTIQNIILQEMESLDGIMIATTNLQQNLDKAFERRFLYKIKFDKPNADARACIWHEMIPELNENDIHALSERYDFSGGQIENIARHYNIDAILHGTDGCTMETLTRHCDNEQITEEKPHKIGF